MKKTAKLIVIIAIIALIVFSITGCEVECEVCGGTGICQKCNGNGVVMGVKGKSEACMYCWGYQSGLPKSSGKCARCGGKGIHQATF